MSDSISLSKPLDDSVVNGSDFTLVWHDYGHGDTFKVEIADNIEFTQIVFEQTVASATKLRVRENLGEKGEVYFWRVTGEHDGVSYTSRIGSFEAWSMHHTPEFDEGANPDSVQAGVEPEDIHVGPILSVVGAVIVFLVFAVVIVFNWVDIEAEAARIGAITEDTNPVVREAILEAEKNIGQYGTNPDGTYRIPVDQIMEIMANEAAGSQGIYTDIVKLVP